VIPFASAQGALQYLLPSAGTYLQAGSAHPEVVFIRNSFLWNVPGTLPYWVHSTRSQYRAARTQKDVQFCSEMTGQPLYKATAAEPDLYFLHEIDSIGGVLPGYFSLYAVAYLRG
jgi:hypothetical protein